MDRKTFARLVRRKRFDLGKTQKEFAEEVLGGLSQQAIGQWERGITVPDEKSFHLLAEVLAVDVGELYSLKEKSNMQSLTAVSDNGGSSLNVGGDYSQGIRFKSPAHQYAYSLMEGMNDEQIADVIRFIIGKT